MSFSCTTSGTLCWRNRKCRYHSGCHKAAALVDGKGYQYIYIYICLFMYLVIALNMCAAIYLCLSSGIYIYIVLRSLHSIPCFFLAKAIPIDGYEMGGGWDGRGAPSRASHHRQESSQDPGGRLVLILLDPPCFGLPLPWIIAVFLSSKGFKIMIRNYMTTCICVYIPILFAL